MKRLFQNKPNNYFSFGLLLVLISFLYTRPLNSPWHPFIAGDGLGYYAYLPAKFIHNDPQLDFKWFNRVHNQNYAYSTFDNPEDNLLVQYGDKRIDKYYQGLSYIWMPFFVAGHMTAKLFHYTPDGFSKPYQIWMGIASLAYLFLGLILLRLLLLRLYRSQWIAGTVPFLFFFGTHLFTYAIAANTLSHAYSFTFITGFLYFTVRFLQEPGRKTQNLLLSILFLVISFCIRPLTILVVLAIPAFVPSAFSIRKLVFERMRLVHYIILLLAAGALFWQLWLTKIQTGSFFAYTYTDEKFIFADARFLDALFSYHMGLFVYAPLIFISVLGFFTMRWRMALPLVVLFFGVIFLYSAWWYWPITKRALIDFYAIPACTLGALFSKIQNEKLKIGFLIACVLSVFYFQLKAFQMRNGILDEYLTYKELFWENFFRTEHANIFPVPPVSIIQKESHVVSFEEPSKDYALTDHPVFEGKHAMVLDREHYISKVAEYPFSPLFKEKAIRKIKISFELFAEDDLEQVHAFLKFMRHNGSEILVVPFYMNNDYLQHGKWDRKEFGYDLVDVKQLNADSVDKIELVVWNVNPAKKAYVDHFVTDFLLTDRHFETVK